MSSSEIITIALVILVPAILLWGVFLMRNRKRRKPAAALGIPHAMRPAAPDDVLENQRLFRIQLGGFLALVVTAITMVVYWLPEAQRQEAFASRFDEEAVHRGELIYQAPPPLEEDIEAVAFKELEKELALGQGCANCHGGIAKDEETKEIDPARSATGGIGFPYFKDPRSGKTIAYTAPPLNTVFSRWDEEVVRFTIERGRPGTDMPTWGVEYGGSMTSLMVDDVMEFLRSIQVPLDEISDDCKKPNKQNQMECGQEIFEARCAVCHGPKGQGKEDKVARYDDPNTPEELLDNPDEDNYPVWYQGMALWKGDVGHLSKNLHYLTVYNGRRFAFMPPFGEAPAQGIPIPPNPLTDQQIEAVISYERSL